MVISVRRDKEGKVISAEQYYRNAPKPEPKPQTSRYQKKPPSDTLGNVINKAGATATKIAKDDNIAFKTAGGAMEAVQAEAASAINLVAGGQRVVKPASTYIESAFEGKKKKAFKQLTEQNPARTIGQTIGHGATWLLPGGFILRGTKTSMKLANKAAALLYTGKKQGVERVGSKQFIISEGTESKPGKFTFIDFSKKGKAVEYDVPKKVLPDTVEIFGKAGKSEQKLYGLTRSDKRTWKVGKKEKLLYESGPGLKQVATTKTTKIADVNRQIEAIFGNKPPPKKPKQTTGIILETQHLGASPKSFSKDVSRKLGNISKGSIKTKTPISDILGSGKSGSKKSLSPELVKSVKMGYRQIGKKQQKNLKVKQGLTTALTLATNPVLQSTASKTKQGTSRKHSTALYRTRTKTRSLPKTLRQRPSSLRTTSLAGLSAVTASSLASSFDKPKTLTTRNYQGSNRKKAVIATLPNVGRSGKKSDSKKKRKRGKLKDYEGGAYPHKITGLRNFDVRYKGVKRKRQKLR